MKMHRGLPPRSAGRHAATAAAAAPTSRARGSGSGYGASQRAPGPRDSAEMRSPRKMADNAATASSPPFHQPTSPPGPGATELAPPKTAAWMAAAEHAAHTAAEHAAAAADGHAIVAAAATIQRRWRTAHARRRAQRLQASRAELLAKQAQLEAARGRQSRSDHVDDILSQLSRAREDASESVRQRQAAQRAADDRRRSDASRQQAALKIQMQWLRCRTARHGAAADPSRLSATGGTGAADLMSYLRQTSATPRPTAAKESRTTSLTDLLAAAGAEQYQRRCSRAGRIATPKDVVQASEPEAPPALAELSRAASAPDNRASSLHASPVHAQSSSSVAAGVRTHVSTLKSALAARDAELRDVQQQVEASEKQRADAQLEAGEKLERKLQELRDEYDSTITRQLEFVDGLLKDKEELAEKYTAAATELDETEARWQDKLKKQSSTEKAQLKRHRDSWAAAEKVRREKWMEEQMAQVKAQTIKGLEPEIQRMMTQHKNDLNTAEQNHRNALRRARDDMLEENNQNLRRVRQELQAERTEAIQHERELAAKRMREQAEQSEAALRHELTSHAKLKSEWEADRSRAERERLELRRQLEGVKEREGVLARAQTESQTQLDACKRGAHTMHRQLRSSARPSALSTK
jgi:hypothetical protein